VTGGGIGGIGGIGGLTFGKPAECRKRDIIPGLLLRIRPYSPWLAFKFPAMDMNAKRGLFGLAAW
jgi:hypothetical protein